MCPAGAVSSRAVSVRRSGEAVIGQDENDRGETDSRIVEPRRDARARAEADPVILRNVGRLGGREREVGTAIDDLPPGGFDLAP